MTTERHPLAHAIVLAAQRRHRVGADVPILLTGGALPKQFCSFGNGGSLLQRTVRQLHPLIVDRHVRVVTTTDHAPRARQQLHGLGGDVIEEPRHRGSAITMVRALHDLAAEHPRAPVVVMPAQNAFRESDALIEPLSYAIDAVTRVPEIVVTLASPALDPASDQAWLLLHASRHAGLGLRQVGYFAAAPSRSLAMRLFQVRALWCTHILVGMAAVLLRHAEEMAPDEIGALRRSINRADPSHLSSCYRALPNTRLDQFMSLLPELHALELPHRAGWNDLSTPERVQRWLAPPSRRLRRPASRLE